jgi:hypothetical protein
MKTFFACQRLHLIQYVQGYRSTAPSEALAFGDLMHAGLEAWWRAWMIDRQGGGALAGAMLAMSKRGPDEALLAKAQVVMAGYESRWTADMASYQVVEVEAQFRAPLLTEGGRRARGAKLAGKVDAIVMRDDGTFWLVEHKTHGDLSPTADYWRRLRLDPQISMYFDGARALGYELAGCIYDVLKRPEQSPLKATPVEKRKYLRDRPTVLYANQRAEDETLDEFQERLAEVITAAPHEYYARAEVVRLPEELERFAADVRETSRQILAAGRTQRGGLAPHNPDACFRFGRPCEFYDVCSGAASLDDDTRFRKLDTVHPEFETPKEEAPTP